MLTRNFGSLEVSVAGLGCGNFGFCSDEVQSATVVNAALDAGITHFDTADVYGEGLSEEFLGRALGKRRDDVVVTTKFGSFTQDELRPGSATWVRRACEASLKRLGTDRIDLYLMHQPDPVTPIEETLEALRALKAEGKIREIGCSNFDASQLQQAADAADALGMDCFCTVQNSYSLLDRTAEKALMPTAERLGATLFPYLPLASGMLTGKYRRDRSNEAGGRLGKSLRGTTVSDYFPALMLDESFDIVEALERYAFEPGHTLVELALSWLASKPFVTSVIAGATSAEQVGANVAAISAWPMDEAVQRAIGDLTRDDVAFTWNAGFPSYAKLPEGADPSAVPDVRKQPAADAVAGADRSPS